MQHVFSTDPLNWALRPELARAHCEGLAYRAGGTVIARPRTDNPYSAPLTGEVAAWYAGWDLAEAQSPGALAPGNCAVTGVVPA